MLFSVGATTTRFVARAEAVSSRRLFNLYNGLTGSLRAAWRSLARLKVEIASPKGGLHLVELQVTPAARGCGVGAALLEQVDAAARERGLERVSLTTATDNPAQHLYERAGYRIVDTKTNSRYERITGSAGRVLMVKQLI